MATNNYIFMVAGRTGGPFFPLPAIAQKLTDYIPVYFEVKKGYATKVLINNIKIEILPDVRFIGLSFKTNTPKDKCIQILNLLSSIVGLLYSTVISIGFLIKYKPKAIVSTGSFLAVPLVYASQITNFFKITYTKIIIHQQDPDIGLTHKLIAKYANIKSCVFEYTKLTYPSFSDAMVIPNPIITEKYDNASLADLYENRLLSDFYNNPSIKPLFLIFGGGSGAKIINNWVVENRQELLKKFRIILLTGVLQDEKVPDYIDPDYYQTEILTTEMPFVLKKADLIMCRAGLGSITELLYLTEPAFLVPIADSHQVKNAELIKDYFYTLHQAKSNQWLEIIVNQYPHYFETIVYPETTTQTTLLNNYFDRIKNLLNQ